MKIKKNFFFKKKILVYGLGLSGVACFNFLKKNNYINVYDDNFSNKHKKYKNYYLSLKKITKNNFDYIFISPGININKCKLTNFLQKNKNKIVSDLDIFYKSYPACKKIAITGTNGKSTTCKLLHEVLKKHNRDSRLVGNIGNPILGQKKIKKNTIFVIEVSSYQIDYSRYFQSDFAIILNISPDHLERHGNYNNYIKAKFKLIEKQEKNSISLIDKNNMKLKDILKKKKINSKLKLVDFNKYNNFNKLIKNQYFNNVPNLKNLSFILELSKELKLQKNKILQVVNIFQGLNYRQQVVFDNEKLKIINDSKSTSLSATLPLLESYKNIYWILGGLAKKGDKLNLKRKYFKNIKAYIYGKNKKFFQKLLKNKCEIKYSTDLKQIIKKLQIDLKDGNNKKKIILFSPAAASFDQFNNFEERGKYFNNFFKNLINV